MRSISLMRLHMQWVSYQDCMAEYYFPVEYMAALMTSVIDNPSKVSEYIYAWVVGGSDEY